MGSNFLRKGLLLEEWPSIFRKDTLSRQLLLGVLSSVLLAISAMGIMSYLTGRRQILGYIQQEINGITLNSAQSLQSFFKQRQNDVEAISETSLIGDYHRSRNFGLSEEADLYRRTLANYFARFADRSRVYYDIFFADAFGRRVCSLRDRGHPTETGDPLSVASLMFLRQGRKIDLEPFLLGSGGPLVKRYAKPVFDPAGQFLGGIVMDLDMRHVEDILGKVRVGRVGSAYIEDEEGRVVVGSRPGLRQPLLSVAAIPETPWRLGVIASADDFLGPVQQIRRLTILFSILTCFVVAVLVLWRVSSLLKPVKEMVEGTRRYAAGDMTYRISEPRAMELRVLASSFNTMAESLEARGAEIERQFRQLRALREMEETVLEHGTEEAVMKACLQAVARGFGFDRTALYWIDEKRRLITGKAVYGSEEMGLTRARFQMRAVPLGGNDILNVVVRTRKPEIVRNVHADERLNKDFVHEARTREFVMAPICGKEKVLGVITADNYFSRRPLVEADREGLRVFANAVGLAMENVQLFDSLRESEAKYRTVLENSPEAVIGLSKELWIVTWNRGAKTTFGYAEQEMMGKPLLALFSTDQAELCQAMITRAMAEGPLRDYAVQGTTKAGKVVDLSVSWGGTQGDFWTNKEWTLVIRDVTEAKRMQQQLIRSEKLSAVGQLISGIAHELNNPLQAVVGYADLLTEELKGPAKEKARPDTHSFLADLQVITDNAMRCQKIIENLLLFVRQGEIKKKPLDIARAAQAAVDLLHYKLKKAANVEVTSEIPPSLPKGWGNFQQIQQVLINLINNATDAMAGQTTPKMIRIAAAERDGMIRVEVADSGPGIPESVRGRLFEPFFTTKGEGRGTGLGLAVCKQIIEDHGGRMGFRTQLGQGTTFFFELPVSREGIQADALAAPPAPPVRDKAVLVVDDEPDVLSFLAKVLLAEGDRVDMAASLQEAAERIASVRFDLVVADIRLGEGTGIHLFENWAEWSKHPRPPFLFITGDVVNTALAHEVETKGLRILHKPLDISSLQTAVRGLLVQVSG